MSDPRSPYVINANAIPPADLGPPPGKLLGGALTGRLVYGTDTSIMIAERVNGYHSVPHYHDAEQMNYIVNGSVWFFIDDHGFKAVKGDVVRVPRNSLHWVWVLDPEGLSMWESHCPPLIGDEKLRAAAKPLLADDEDRSGIIGVRNLFAEVTGMDELERRVMGAEYPAAAAE